MLKGLILAGMIALVWAAIGLTLLRAWRPTTPLNLIVTVFAPAIPLYGVLYGLTPPTLGFLPQRLSQILWPLGPLNGLLALLLFFVTGVQFYYHFHNSITLRLLADFKRSPSERLTMAQLDAAWNLTNLLDARLHALDKARLIRHSEGRYYPTAGGLFLAAVARLTWAILR